MPEFDLTRLTQGLAILTRKAMAERMALEDWAVDAGFRPGCIGVLQVVAALAPISQREVSDRLLLDPSDLVGLVDILERAGYVERHRDPVDRRRYALEITTAGELAVVRLKQVAADATEQVLAPLSDGERAQFGDLLRRVIAHHTGPTGPFEPALRADGSLSGRPPRG
jgi:DNA-binding MarR family transcriptional regulator